MSLEALAARQVERITAEREHNRELMARHMPECLRLIDELKQFGMFGKVCSFSLNEELSNA